MVGRTPGRYGHPSFLAAGPPWWFAFHSVPHLPETVLVGHEAEYLDWFLDDGTADHQGVDPAIRDAFVSAYTGREPLRCGFEYYRAATTNAEQLRSAVENGRLTAPTLAIGANTVGEALHNQLRPFADDLTGYVLNDCGHIIPLDRPAELLAALTPFLS